MKNNLTRICECSMLVTVIAGLSVCHAQEEVPAVPAADPVVNALPAPVPAAGLSAPQPVMNQPLVLNSFENVEMERLRIADELAKTHREDLAFKAELLRLQKKLASSSLSVAAPKSIPTDYRSFLSLNEGGIESGKKYYALLKSTLNDLTPESPYLARTSGEIADPKRAASRLLELEKFDEDEGICRTIRGQLAGSVARPLADRQRIFIIDKSLTTLAKDKRDLERNYQMTYDVSPLTGRARGSESERRIIQQKIDAVAVNEKALLDEKTALSHVAREGGVKLQFQQFIVELAIQQRNIHALIACGFYRQSTSRGDLTLSKEAYPSGRDKKSAGPAVDPFGLPSPASAIPAAVVPIIDTVSGMEVFLTNRIRDAIKERDAMDNMLKEKQLGAAESLLIKMVMTAKYQPELQTIPYRSRQTLLNYGQDMRALSDAVNARDYREMKSLSDRIESAGSDSGMTDIKHFATEQPGKAMYLVRQAELALKAGDRKAAQSMTDAAVQRAPLDPDVKRKIEDLQSSFVSNSRLADELDNIIQSGDYKAAFNRRNEFAPIAGISAGKQKKAEYEKLLEKEKSVRSILEKCDVFERHASYPDMWIELSELAPDLAEDSRLVSRKSGMTGKCPRFVSAYTNATEHERSGADSIALAWYLTALSEAPGNTLLTEKVKQLGTKSLNP